MDFKVNTLCRVVKYYCSMNIRVQVKATLGDQDKHV